MKTFFHYCSKGLKSDLLFATPKEYIAGMNRVAICYLISEKNSRKVLVISYCLMDNHVHFILYGTREACDVFVADYKRLTGIWIRNNRKERLHDNMDFGCGYPIASRESLRERIAYVLRNPMAAGINLTPAGYRWGTGILMFSNNSWITDSSRKVSSFSQNALFDLFDSKQVFPGEWLVLEDGLIWPGCYTETDVAMRQFSSVGDYLFCINDSRIDKRTNEEMFGSRVSIPDGEIKDHARNLAGSMFDKKYTSKCTPAERLEIARRLRKELFCGHKQLARVLGLKEEDLRMLV